MAEITKEEIVALTEAQIKVAVALEHMVDKMTTIAENNNIITDKISNSLCTITQQTLENSRVNTKILNESIKLGIDGVHGDVKWLKIVFGSTCTVVFGYVVIRLIKEFAILLAR